MLSCVIFDLDGVLVSTDEYHYLAWKAIANQLGVPFDRTDNLRQRGVSRMESLEVVLEKCSEAFSAAQKEALAKQKNDLYLQSLQASLGPDCVLPGVLTSLQALQELGIRCAIGSSSKNAPFILEKTGLSAWFPTVVSGLDIKHSKPDPEVFVLAGQRAGFPAAACLVVEDADTGIDAGLAAGMKVMAVGAAYGNPKAYLSYRSLDDTGCRWEQIAGAFH